MLIINKLKERLYNLNILKTVERMKGASIERRKRARHRAEGAIKGLMLEMEAEGLIYFESLFVGKLWIHIPYFEGDYSLENILAFCHIPNKEVFIITLTPPKVIYAFNYLGDMGDESWIITFRGK